MPYSKHKQIVQAKMPDEAAQKLLDIGGKGRKSNPRQGALIKTTKLRNAGLRSLRSNLYSTAGEKLRTKISAGKFQDEISGRNCLNPLSEIEDLQFKLAAMNAVKTLNQLKNSTDNDEKDRKTHIKLREDLSSNKTIDEEDEHTERFIPHQFSAKVEHTNLAKSLANSKEQILKFSNPDFKLTNIV